MKNLEFLIKYTLNPLREQSNQELVDKINELIEAVAEIQNHINEVNIK